MDQIIAEASRDNEIILTPDALAERRSGEHSSGATIEFIADTFNIVGTVVDAGEGVAEFVSGSFDIGEIAAEAGWLALVMIPIVGVVWGAFRLNRAARRWLAG